MLLFSEATKDSNRENNMMNHRMVHESPGYLCPFCPDREHKCPRPHNLQQHAHFHHAEKDKDNLRLEDAMSQQIDGPSREKRRRGGPI